MDNVESSDDEPIFRSPEPSDSEDQGLCGTDDFFKFTARKFQGSCNSNSPAPVARRKRHAPSMEEKWNIAEQQQKNRAKRVKGNFTSEHTVEVDSDEEVQNFGTCNPSIKGSINKMTNDPAKRTIQDRQDHEIVDLLDSDSDDDVIHANVLLESLREVSKESFDVLQRSQLARFRLLQAQHYHAEDIHVEVTSPRESRIPLSSPEVINTKPIKLGKNLLLKCRAKIEINGTKKAVDDKVLSMHEHEQFSILVQKFLQAHSLPSTARVTIAFDGMTLDAKKCPSDFELEDHDLLDFDAKAIAVPKIATISKVSSGPKISLTLRRKIGRRVQDSLVSLGGNDNFQTLLETYKEEQQIHGTCSLKFDGEELDLRKTPHHYEMEGGDLIDVHCTP